MSEVAAEFVSYFRRLMGTAAACTELDSSNFSMGPVLTATQQQQLLILVTSEDIQQDLLNIGNDKATGPDGYGAKFFKSAWDTAHSDLQQAVEEFFASSRLLKHWNHTLLVLVLKSEHAPKVMDYRPISCCIVVYKIIFKILASRMVEVINSLLDPAHAAFVKDRSVVENIHLAQELLRKYARKRISPR